MASTVIQPPIALVAPFTDPVYALKSDNGTFKGLFTQTIGTNNAVMFQSNGYSFSWKPDNILYIDSANNMDVVYGVNSSASAQYWNNKVTYVGTTQLTSDVFECLNNQLKHTVSLVAPPRLPASYMGTPVNVAVGGVITYDSGLSIVADGTKHTTDFVTNGSLSFQDSTGKEVYSLPKIFAQDANGDITDGQYKVTFNVDGTISLYMMVGWSWLQTASYPVAIDPTVVVASPYDTSGNGGRKIVRLSNGWIVVVTANQSTHYLYFYVSKDNGTTWSQLTSINIPFPNLSFAMCGTNTNVYCVAFSIGSSNAGQFMAFDATTVGSSITATSIETVSGFGPGATFTVDNSGVIHVAYCCQTSTYNSSYNIHYSKSSNGGSTWPAINILTTMNTTGWYAQNPCLVVNSSSLPTIVWDTQQGTNVNSIMASTWNGTAWNTVTVYAGGTTQQSKPCAIVDTNNHIHVFWLSSTTTILHSVSTDGGTTWSAPDTVYTGTSVGAPSVIYGSSTGTNYIYFSAGTTSTVYYVSGTTNSWSTTTTIGTGSNPQGLWSEFNENSSDTYRYIYNTGSAINYDSISTNAAPNAPTLSPHANFDATQSQSFSWTFSDPNISDSQSAFQLQIYDVGTTTTVLDTGKVASTISSYTLNASTLTNGHNYQWRVTTWDQSGVQGPYSSYSSFSCAAGPTVTITAPSGTLQQSSLTVKFSYSDSGNNPQQSYQVQLLDVSDSTVLSDSGTTTSSNTQYTISYVLGNNATYHVRVRATNSLNVTSSWADVSFNTSFTSVLPATLTITPLSAQGKITLTMTNFVTTNLAMNSGSETATETAQVFADALTSYTGSTVPAPWTNQAGSWTFGASGATSGASASIMTAGNTNWEAITGTSGQNLSLTKQASFTMPASFGTSYYTGNVQFFKDMNNRYVARIDYTENLFAITKFVGGVSSTIASVAFTPLASTTYTITLTLDNSGHLTAKLYSGQGTGGTLLQTLTPTDTSLTGGFQIGVGGDTGVIVSHAQVNAPFADGWTIVGDSRVAWSLTINSIDKKYSLNATGASSGIISSITQSPTLSALQSYTISGSINSSSLGTSGAYIELDANSTQVAKTSVVSGTTTTNRYQVTGTTGSSVTSPTLKLVIADAGSVTFDNIQLETGTTATTYIENDSATQPQSSPAIAYNDVYRKKNGTSTWTRIATNIPSNGSYDDYTTASSVSYDYKITTIGNNQTSADSNVVSNESITFRGLMVHQVSNPSDLLNLMYQTQPKNDEWVPQATTMKYAGRTNDVVQFGENETYTLASQQTVIMDSDNQWDALNSMIRAKSTLCVRDGRGRKMFGAVLNLKTTDLEFGKQVDLEFTQVDFNEAV